MQHTESRATTSGRRAAGSGIVAALAAPAALIVGSDAAMFVAILAFCFCVVMGHDRASDRIQTVGTAIAATIVLICIPTTSGPLQAALALSFSAGCLALASSACGGMRSLGRTTEFRSEPERSV